MFCPKCGNQIPDGAAFCASCGNAVGGKAPAKSASTGMPPIMNSLVTKLVGFFTGNRQEAVVVDAAKDTTWSGAIVAGVGILIYTLTQLVNVMSAGRLYLMLSGLDYGDTFDYADYMFEIGAPVGVSALFAVLYAVVLVVMTFAMAKMCKVNIPFVSAVNIAAYASLPVVLIGIPNMLFGLLWGALPVMFFLVAMIASFYLIHQAIVKAYGVKSAFLPFLLMVIVVLLVVVLGAYFTFTASRAGM